jgi:hypothetical protein
MNGFKLALCAGIAAFTMGASQAALADPAAAPAAPAPNPMASPAMGAVLSANPDPLNFNLGPAGKIYVTGALTALGMTQNNVNPGDHATWGDISNAQIFIQKTDGVVQFFIEAGDYSLPALGTTYTQSDHLVTDTFGAVPVAYLKIVPNASFSVEAGKLPTLVGAEGIFTFENNNIERGLLWNQEPVVSQGVQANFSHGPISLSLAFTDGYYSQRLNWLSGLAAFAITPRDTITFVGAGALSSYDHSSFATPVVQNNSEIFNLIFTHTEGPFSITPYLQYSHVPTYFGGGTFGTASSMSGAVLAKYSFTPEFSIAGRVEYIGTSAGSTAACPVVINPGVEAISEGPPPCFLPQTNLLYGPSSNAWSLTITPTYQYKVFFIRGELSYTDISNGTPFFEFGPTNTATSQVRGLIETGILF